VEFGRLNKQLAIQVDEMTKHLQFIYILGFSGAKIVILLNNK
jgi:hypothetical protein